MITNGIVVIDSKERQLNVTFLDNGKIMFSIPSGKPGKLKCLLVLNREDVRKFSNDLISLVGEYDQ